MTVGGLLAAATATLAARAALAQPAREARFLLAHLLRRSESWLLAHPEEELGAEREATFADWVRRRLAGEPAHYIVGSCPFWGRELLVTPDVLIPRPESELIVERALALALGERPRVLDVATGSGCLAVTLAVEIPRALVTATDASLPALAVARRNATRHDARVALTCGDLASHHRGPFDLVVANLPYLPEALIAALQREVRDHEPRAALAGGPDGAHLLRRLVADLPRLLAPGGTALLELGPGQADLLAPAVRTVGLTETERISDAGGVERVLVLRHPEERRLRRDEGPRRA